MGIMTIGNDPSSTTPAHDPSAAALGSAASPATTARADHGSGAAVMWALIANVAIAAMKFVCAALGSMTMLSEGIHSLVDSANEITLIIGKRLSKPATTRQHPWGTGRGRYLASFIVALLLFLGGGAYSTVESVERIHHILTVAHGRHVETTGLIVSLVTIIIAMGMESFSLHKSVIEARARFASTHETGVFNLFRFWSGTKSSDLLAVIAEDVLAVASLTISAVCTIVALATGDEVWDGIGGLLVGILLMSGSVLLTRHAVSLLLGEGASEHTVGLIRSAVEGDADIRRVLRLQTMHLDEDHVLLCLKVETVGDREPADIVNDLEERLRAAVSWYDLEIVVEIDRFDPERAALGAI